MALLHEYWPVVWNGLLSTSLDAAGHSEVCHLIQDYESWVLSIIVAAEYGLPASLNRLPHVVPASVAWHRDLNQYLSPRALE